MKSLIFITLLLSLNLSADDSKFEKAILGKWLKVSPNSSVKFVGTFEFFKNKTFGVNGKMTLINSGKSIKVIMKGEWKIKDGFIEEKVNQSTLPFSTKISKDEIISITKEKFVYKDKRNITHFYTKVKNE
jgi:hypothetical protein